MTMHPTRTKIQIFIFYLCPNRNCDRIFPNILYTVSSVIQHCGRGIILAQLFFLNIFCQVSTVEIITVYFWHALTALHLWIIARWSDCITFQSKYADVILDRFALRDIARISLSSEQRLAICSVHRNYDWPRTESFMVRKCQVFRDVTQCRLVNCYRISGGTTIFQNVGKCLKV
jgi:hypothetical protein